MEDAETGCYARQDPRSRRLCTEQSRSDEDGAADDAAGELDRPGPAEKGAHRIRPAPTERLADVARERHRHAADHEHHHRDLDERDVALTPKLLRTQVVRCSDEDRQDVELREHSCRGSPETTRQQRTECRARSGVGRQRGLGRSRGAADALRGSPIGRWTTPAHGAEARLSGLAPSTRLRPGDTASTQIRRTSLPYPGTNCVEWCVGERVGFMPRGVGVSAGGACTIRSSLILAESRPKSDTRIATQNRTLNGTGASRLRFAARRKGSVRGKTQPLHPGLR